MELIILKRNIQSFLEEIELNEQAFKDWKLTSFGLNEAFAEEFPAGWKDIFRRLIPHLEYVGTVQWILFERLKEHWE
jgi:hypothetical protein